MLTPETVQRDENGYWSHSAIDGLFGDEESVPGNTWREWLAEHNIEVTSLEMQDDLPEDHPLWQSYFEDGEPDCSKWTPEPPGPEWYVLCIFEDEEGPAFVWYRERKLDTDKEDGDE